MRHAKTLFIMQDPNDAEIVRVSVARSRPSAGTLLAAVGPTWSASDLASYHSILSNRLLPYKLGRGVYRVPPSVLYQLRGTLAA